MHKRSKVLLGIIVLLSIVLAVILIKGDNQTPEITLSERLSGTSLEGLQPVEVKEVKEEVPVITETIIEFQNIEYALTQNGFNFKGVLHSNNTEVDGLIIKLFCNDKEVINTLVSEGAVTLTDNDGSFKFTSDCKANDVAYAQLQYGDSTFESTHVVVPHGRFGHRSANIMSSPAAGVPEYSTLTIGFAVMTVLFGLVFLRKR